MQVIDMPEHNPGQMGGTMRLGKRRTIFKNNTSVLRKKNFTFTLSPAKALLLNLPRTES